MREAATGTRHEFQMIGLVRRGGKHGDDGAAGKKGKGDLAHRLPSRSTMPETMSGYDLILLDSEDGEQPARSFPTACTP